MDPSEPFDLCSFSPSLRYSTGHSSTRHPATEPHHNAAHPDSYLNATEEWDLYHQTVVSLHDPSLPRIPTTADIYAPEGFVDVPQEIGKVLSGVFGPGTLFPPGYTWDTTSEENIDPVLRSRPVLDAEGGVTQLQKGQLVLMQIAGWRTLLAELDAELLSSQRINVADLRRSTRGELVTRAVSLPAMPAVARSTSGVPDDVYAAQQFEEHDGPGVDGVLSEAMAAAAPKKRRIRPTSPTAAQLSVQIEQPLPEEVAAQLSQQLAMNRRVRHKGSSTPSGEIAPMKRAKASVPTKKTPGATGRRRASNPESSGSSSGGFSNEAPVKRRRNTTGGPAWYRCGTEDEASNDGTKRRKSGDGEALKVDGEPTDEAPASAHPVDKNDQQPAPAVGGPGNWVCDVCGKKWTNRSAMLRHAYIHTKHITFTCSCGRTFPRQDTIRSHCAKKEGCYVVGKEVRKEKE